MSAGFTPGPWSVGPAHVVRQQTVDDEGRRVTRFVAEAVLSAPFVEGEREANARLIAAAPDGYSAAENSVARLETLLAYTTTLTAADQGVVQECINELRGFLAKARGGQP